MQEHVAPVCTAHSPAHAIALLRLVLAGVRLALIPMILATPALAGVTIAALGGIAVEVVLGKS